MTDMSCRAEGGGAGWLGMGMVVGRDCRSRDVCPLHLVRVSRLEMSVQGGVPASILSQK